jgi:hypothetical protein
MEPIYRFFVRNGKEGEAHFIYMDIGVIASNACLNVCDACVMRRMILQDSHESQNETQD